MRLVLSRATLCSICDQTPSAELQSHAMEYLSIVPKPLAGPLDYLVELPDVRVDGVLAGNTLELGLQRPHLALQRDIVCFWFTS